MTCTFLSARAAIAQREKSVQLDGVDRYEIALVYTGLGRNTHAFHWLEEAYRDTMSDLST